MPAPSCPRVGRRLAPMWLLTHESRGSKISELRCKTLIRNAFQLVATMRRLVDKPLFESGASINIEPVSRGGDRRVTSTGGRYGTSLASAPTDVSLIYYLGGWRPDSKFGSARRAGSTPATRTIFHSQVGNSPYTQREA